MKNPLLNDQRQDAPRRLFRSLGDKGMQSIVCKAMVLLLISAMTTMPISGYSQGAGEPSYLGNSKYIEVSAGVGLGKLRDFATSPLFYNGVTNKISGTLSHLSQTRDVSTSISTLTGTLTSDYNNHTAQSKLTTYSLHHARLYQILRDGSKRWNLKVGGEINLKGNIRINQAFRNSAAGIEAFPVLFGTVKVTRDLTRTTGRGGKEPLKKSLSFKVNAGIIASSFRNGYSYLGIGQIIDKKGFEGLLDGYQFKTFGASALNTRLDYTLWLKNKNGWRFSYEWDVCKTRKDYANFEMATHTLGLALLFSTKKR